MQKISVVGKKTVAPLILIEMISSRQLQWHQPVALWVLEVTLVVASECQLSLTEYLDTNPRLFLSQTRVRFYCLDLNKIYTINYFLIVKHCVRTEYN